MSFVGTRPEVTKYVKKYTKEMRATLLLPAGMADITGVRASNIARFERASCMPTLIMLEKYANALGKHIEIRICEDEE